MSDESQKCRECLAQAELKIMEATIEADKALLGLREMSHGCLPLAPFRPPLRRAVSALRDAGETVRKTKNAVNAYGG